MEYRISATELARKLGDIIGRVRYRHESFIVVRNGDPVARLEPVRTGTPPSVREVLAAWRAAGPPDPALADDLDRVGAADRPPQSPWAS